MPARSLDRVLVVEPDPAVQRSLDQWLTRHGFLATAVPDGTRALSLIETRDYAVLVIELDLPDQSGLEVIEKARQLKPGLPVVAMASEERFDWAVGCLRAGVLDYVVKPAKLDALGPTLEPALERRKTVVESRRTLAELNAVTDEFLRHMVRLERENIDLREKLEGDSDDQAAVVDEFNLLLCTADALLADELGALAEQHGMRLTTVGSGEEALKTLDDLYFDVIIVDNVLPGLEGLEVVRRAHAKVPDSELVIVVGFTSADAAIRAMELGAAAFLLKPLDPSQAAERLEGLRKRHELSGKMQRYLTLFRARYREFLDRYQSVRERLAVLKPEDLD